MGFIEQRYDELDVQKMLADDRVETAVRAILVELARAEHVHPVWPENTLRQVAIMAGEAGEALQAGLHHAEGRGDIDAIRQEAIQTGAMAIRCLINLEK